MEKSPAGIDRVGSWRATSRRAARFALLLPGGVALMAGSLAALTLLGLEVPGDSERLAASHGIVMVLGFVGTVISLERAVALGAAWGFVSPALLGVGGIALLTPLEPRIGGGAITLGALALLAVYGSLLRRHLAPEVVVQALGAVLVAGGAIIWLGGAPVATAVPWWTGFVILTIAGERAELARIHSPRMGADTLRVSAVVVTAVLAATMWPAVGGMLLGAALLTLVVVLVRADVAQRMVRASGLQRFSAAAMLLGYGWLAIAGTLWLTGSPISAGVAYDAAIHAVFLGFTMSMIMAHAPIILPAVLRIRLPYTPLMYGPLGLLHASLLLRLLGGDAYGLEWALVGGGVLNIAAVILFVLTSIGSASWAGLGSRRESAPADGLRPSEPSPQAEPVR